jgi:hypothetical protein
MPKMQNVELKLSIEVTFRTELPESLVTSLTASLGEGSKPKVDGLFRKNLVKHMPWAQLFEDEKRAAFVVARANAVDEDGALDIRHEISPMYGGD